MFELIPVVTIIVFALLTVGCIALIKYSNSFEAKIAYAIGLTSSCIILSLVIYGFILIDQSHARILSFYTLVPPFDNNKSETMK